MMKKRLSLLMILVLAVGLLSGCHGARKSIAFTTPEEFDTSRNYEISFWAKNDTNKTQTEIYTKAISDFEALYPNIKVNIKLYTDYGKIYNDVITNMKTGTTPNVCITYPDHIATYLTGENTVVPLDDLMHNAKYGLGGSALAFDSPKPEEVVPEFLEECKVNGYYHALPYMRSTEACYVNKTMVEKLGYELPEILTWDFVWEVSEAAMEKNGDTFRINGQKTLIPFIYKSTDNMMIQMLRQQDAGYVTAGGDIQLFNDTTKALLLEISEHAKTRAFSTFKISSYPGNFLNAGQCIFAIDSTAGATWMGSHAPNLDIAADKLVEFEMEVLPVPQFDTANPKMISQGPSVCLFNKDDPQEVLASWLFMQYLLTNDVQIAYSETEGYVPVTTKAQNDASYQDYLSRSGEDYKTHYDAKIKAAKLLMSHTEHTFTTPVFNGSTSVRDAAGQLIEDVTKSVRRKQTVDDAYIEKLYKETEALYHLDQISVSEEGKQDLGALPVSSVVLLTTLVCVWVLIAVWFVADRIRKKKAAKHQNN